MSAVVPGETPDERDVRILCEVESGLTEWEVRFAESLRVFVIDRGEALSPKQRGTLDRILTRLNL